MRLPDYRSIIQCGTVCKRWFSLICSPEYFIRSFNHHHRRKRLLMGSRYSPSFPYTLLTRGAYRTHSGLSPIKHNKSVSHHDYFPEASRILHNGGGPPPSSVGGNANSGYLDFLGWPPGEYFPLIRSSFDDLLLVEKTRKDFYICNPLTRRWIALPEAPLNPEALDIIYRSGFVCETDNSRCNEQESYIKYSVVVIGTDNYELLYHAAIFSSETGRWTESTFQFPVRTGNPWDATESYTGRLAPIVFEELWPSILAIIIIQKKNVAV